MPDVARGVRAPKHIYRRLCVPGSPHSSLLSLIVNMSLQIDSSITTPDGAFIPYQVYGSSDPGAPLIVLSNPLLVTWAVWNMFIAFFFANTQNKKYRILYYQTRGRSDQYGSKDITLGVLAGDIIGLLDAVHVQKAAAVVGVSIGGATALNFALTYPERTESLVCSSIFAKNPLGMQQQWEERVAIATKEGAVLPTGEKIIGSNLAELTVRRWFVPESFDGGAMQREIETIKESVEGSSLNGFARIVKALYNFDLTKEMGKSTIKATFVVGDQDGVLPRVMLGMSRGFGREAGYALIKGAGHLPMVEKADAFAYIVTNFLSQVSVLQLNISGVDQQ